jgi:hypothetical protein
MFAEYRHTWWQDATFSTPTASPAFNYTFRRPQRPDQKREGGAVEVVARAASLGVSPQGRCRLLAHFGHRVRVHQCPLLSKADMGPCPKTE